MKAVIDESPRSTTTLIRDEHDESGTYYSHTVEYDDDILHRNKRVRLEGLVPEGKVIPVHDAPVRFAFSCPPAQFKFFCRDHPDIAKGLKSRDDEERMKAARKMAILKPQWAVIAGDW